MTLNVVTRKYRSIFGFRVGEFLAWHVLGLPFTSGYQLRLVAAAERVSAGADASV